MDLSHLVTALETGRVSRQEVLEEIERHLNRSLDAPITGAFEILLEELYKTPSDPHLLRLLARLHQRDGDPDGAKRALEMAVDAGSHPLGTEADDFNEAEASLSDRLLVARMLLGAGFVEEAAVVASRAVDDEQRSLAALNLLAKIRHVQGRLTDMIMLWHRMQLLSPTREGALAQLGLLQRLAENEALAGKQFVPVGPDVFVRKREGQLELELAFSKFREHDFAGAVAVADGLANSERGKNRELYKLAVLQKAWIQERSDNLDGARDTLEQLGRERGFETDLDRLTFLAGVCERIGSVSSIEKALHIYKHLNVQYGKLSALPRLAALHERRGNVEQAERHLAEYELRFAQRMQKLQMAGVLRALALRYIPLDRVPALRWKANDRAECELELRLARGPTGRRRREALLAFLERNVVEATHRFEDLVQVPEPHYKDLAYLGDLHLLQGRPSVQTHLRALLGGGLHEPWLWDRILVASDVEPSAFESLSDDDWTSARAVLRHRTVTRRSQSWVWDHLARFEQIAGDEAGAASYRDKASALRSCEARSVGCVLVAARYSLGGKPKGVVHEVIASRRRVEPGTGGELRTSDLLGNLPPTFLQYVHLVLAMTKDYLRSNWPHLGRELDDYVYTLRITKDDEPSSGTSSGLAIAMALLSVMLDRPVPGDLCMTGSITGDARSVVVVRPVGDAVFKVKGAYHRDLRTILLPEQNLSEVEAADELPASVVEQLVAGVGDLDDAVQAVWGDDAWFW